MKQAFNTTRTKYDAELTAVLNAAVQLSLSVDSCLKLGQVAPGVAERLRNVNKRFDDLFFGGEDK